jgi:hypothetical protein
LILSLGDLDLTSEPQTVTQLQAYLAGEEVIEVQSKSTGRAADLLIASSMGTADEARAAMRELHKALGHEDEYDPLMDGDVEEDVGRRTQQFVKEITEAFDPVIGKLGKNTVRKEGSNEDSEYISEFNLADYEERLFSKVGQTGPAHIKTLLERCTDELQAEYFSDLDEIRTRDANLQRRERYITDLTTLTLELKKLYKKAHGIDFDLVNGLVEQMKESFFGYKFRKKVSEADRALKEEIETLDDSFLKRKDLSVFSDMILTLLGVGIGLSFEGVLPPLVGGGIGIGVSYALFGARAYRVGAKRDALKRIPITAQLGKYYDPGVAQKHIETVVDNLLNSGITNKLLKREKSEKRFRLSRGRSLTLQKNGNDDGIFARYEGEMRETNVSYQGGPSAFRDQIDFRLDKDESALELRIQKGMYRAWSGSHRIWIKDRKTLINETSQGTMHEKALQTLKHKAPDLYHTLYAMLPETAVSIDESRLGKRAIPMIQSVTGDKLEREDARKKLADGLETVYKIEDFKTKG